MIVDIPTPEDFRAQGTVFLHLAWDILIDLYRMVEQSGLADGDDDGSWSDDFWAAAQRPLANAYVLVGQGAEFLLKGVISEVSPFLLIQGGPREWPARAQLEDVPFARFRTADSQDLPKIHDTVRPVRLDPAFRTTLERVREARNTIIHTIDRNNRVAPAQVLSTILEIVHHLVGERTWVQARWDYHAQTPHSTAYSTDYVEHLMHLDVMTASDILAPADVLRYFGFDKKQRRYICLPCRYMLEGDVVARTALLESDADGAARVRCFVCQKTEPVTREVCSGPDCLGNVVSAISGACLTCFSHSTVI